MSDVNGSWAVEFRAVNKRYKYFSLEDLNFHLPQGEILGLVGPNGAGKSTCLRLLMGFVQPDSGSIRVLNKAVPEHSLWLKERAAFVSEDMRLFAEASIEWHMGFVKGFFKRWDETYAQKLLSCFELNPRQKIKELSLGQRIKTTLLLALARHPQLLVLDEPSTGLDPIARFELMSQLFDIMLNEESSVIFSSQFTQDVERISDSIAFMDRGRLISHQDKETYLGKWRRLELVGRGVLPLMHNVLDVQPYSGGFSLTHADFDGETIAQLEVEGFKVTGSHIMTLEEIFISQVRLSRAVKEAACNV